MKIFLNVENSCLSASLLDGMGRENRSYLIGGLDHVTVEKVENTNAVKGVRNLIKSIP